jgi:hypothetical protein
MMLFRAFFLAETVKVEVVLGEVIHGQSFSHIVGTQHSGELLVGFQDFFLVVGGSPHQVCFFLCWPEEAANKGTKVVGILAKRYK